MSIFGFAHTNIGLVIRHCKTIVGSNGIQFITKREALVRRRCYIVLGVSTLDAVRIRVLNQSTSILIVIDALPELLRIRGIEVLDAPKNVFDWRPVKTKFVKLDNALRAKPKSLKVSIFKDNAIDDLIVEVKNLSILDNVLSAAKSLDAPTRAILHMDVARLLSGKITVESFRKRCESRNSSGKLFEKMITALSGETAKRLSVALKETLAGEDVIKTAAKHKVEASELRFLLAKLKEVK